VIESNDLDEMVDIAAAFVDMGKRLPAGHRVAIASSSGGGGAWVADACALAGLEMPLLDDATRAKIDVYLPPYGTSQNPVDVTAQAIHDALRRVRATGGSRPTSTASFSSSPAVIRAFWKTAIICRARRDSKKPCCGATTLTRSASTC
jgi:hypothetical protein